MRTTLYVLVDENGLRDGQIALVTDDPKVAQIWRDREAIGACCHVEEVALNRATFLVDARKSFFKQARRLNPQIVK